MQWWISSTLFTIELLSLERKKFTQSRKPGSHEKQMHHVKKTLVKNISRGHTRGKRLEEKRLWWRINIVQGYNCILPRSVFPLVICLWRTPVRVWEMERVRSRNLVGSVSTSTQVAVWWSGIGGFTTASLAWNVRAAGIAEKLQSKFFCTLPIAKNQSASECLELFLVHQDYGECHSIYFIEKFSLYS